MNLDTRFPKIDYVQPAQPQISLGIQSLEYLEFLSKKGGKDQQTIQSSTIPDPGYHMGK